MKTLVISDALFNKWLAMKKLIGFISDNAFLEYILNIVMSDVGKIKPPLESGSSTTSVTVEEGSECSQNVSRKRRKRTSRLNYNGLIKGRDFVIRQHSNTSNSASGDEEFALFTFQENETIVKSEEDFVEISSEIEVENVGESSDHSDDNKTCTECSPSVTFESREIFQHHWTDQHELFVCPFCGIQIDGEIPFSDHKAGHKTSREQSDAEKEDDKVIGCTFCEEKFSNQHRLYIHKLKVHTPACTCSVCGKQCRNKLHLSNHMTWVHLKQNIYECGECGKSFKTENGRKFHIESHHQGVKHHCLFKDCNRKFTTKNGLLVHIAYCHERKSKRDRHLCPTCGKIFFHKEALRKHVNRYHRPVEVRRCAYCQMVFASKQGMLRHVARLHKS